MDLRATFLIFSVILGILTRVYSISGEDDESFVKNHKYMPHEQLTSFLHNLTYRYPQISKLFSIGKSVQNRELWVLRISADVSERPTKVPMVKYIANMHGDESVGRELMIMYSQYLLVNYGKDKRVTNIVNHTDIYIMPSMNPDGFANSQVLYIYFFFQLIETNI